MNKREAILNAALTEFSMNDFENASVNKIIQMANTSKGNFYHYFKNKEELYIVLMKEAWLKKMEFMSVKSEGDFFDFLQKQMLAGIKFSRENPEYFKLSRRFASEKNKKVYNKVLDEIRNNNKNSEFIKIPVLEYEKNSIKNEFPIEFFNKFILLILNNINEMIEETEDLVTIEEKLNLIITVLKKGFSL